MDSNSTQDSMGPIWPHGKDQFDNMNSKIMLGAVISLSFVITVVLILHIYARCVMRRNQARIRQAEAASVHHLPHQVSLQLTDQPLTGLDPRVIASLPLITVKARDSNHNDQEHEEKMPGFDCAVCLSDLEEGETARLLPNCKHMFHVECIDKWLNNQSNCPICRTEVAPFVEMPLEVAVEGEGASESSGIKESGSSSRLSSFRRMISIDWSSSRRIQPSFVVQDVAQDHERQ